MPPTPPPIPVAPGLLESLAVLRSLIRLHVDGVGNGSDLRSQVELTRQQLQQLSLELDRERDMLCTPDSLPDSPTFVHTETPEPFHPQFGSDGGSEDIDIGGGFGIVGESIGEGESLAQLPEHTSSTHLQLQPSHTSANSATSINSTSTSTTHTWSHTSPRSSALSASTTYTSPPTSRPHTPSLPSPGLEGLDEQDQETFFRLSQLLAHLQAEAEAAISSPPAQAPPTRPPTPSSILPSFPTDLPSLFRRRKPAPLLSENNSNNASKKTTGRPGLHRRAHSLAETLWPRRSVSADASHAIFRTTTPPNASSSTAVATTSRELRRRSRETGLFTPPHSGSLLIHESTASDLKLCKSATLPPPSTSFLSPTADLTDRLDTLSNPDISRSPGGLLDPDDDDDKFPFSRRSSAALALGIERLVSEIMDERWAERTAWAVVWAGIVWGMLGLILGWGCEARCAIRSMVGG